MSRLSIDTKSETHNVTVIFYEVVRIEQAVYGLDSLAAVERRNWVRTELGVAITTLDVAGAKTLTSLAEKILVKVMNGNEAEKN